MTTVKIPTIGPNPYVVTINNVTYSYPAGATVSVPDEVAAAINNAVRLFPVEKPPHQGDLNTFRKNVGVWETPDAFPQEGSDKPITSGGVKAIFDRITQDPALTILETTSGSVANFTDGADNVPLTSLVCSIVPAQSGEGDPSADNIRPISGWTGMDISHSGEDMSDTDVIEVTWEDEAGTVYGGSLNLLTGVLTADYRLVSFDGTEDWREQVVSSTPTYFYTKVGDLNSCVNDVGVCSHLTEQSGITAANDTVGFRIYNRTVQSTAGATVLIRFDATKQQTLAEFKAYLAAQAAAETPVQVAYKLTQGTEYHLQPHEVKSLLGVNNIWCDTGGTSVTYTADIAKYVEKVTTPVYDMTAEENIASGDYFMVGDRLFLATASIAAGDEIVPDTNCTETNVAEVLNGLGE